MEQIQNKQMIQYKGKIGRAHIQYTGKATTRMFFAPIDNPPSWSKSSDEYETIDKKHCLEATIPQQDEILMEEHKWLGQPVQVHRVGGHIIVEYICKDDNEHQFSAYSHSWPSLDEALIYSILYKNNVSSADNIASFLMKSVDQSRKEGDE